MELETWHLILPYFPKHPLVMSTLEGSILAFPRGINFSLLPYFL